MFTTRPADVSGDAGQEVTLSCAVDGNPAPSYTWYRNGDLNTVSRKGVPRLRECCKGLFTSDVS